MNRIFWSPEAKDTYAAILKYVMDNFPLDVAIKMDEKVERLISLLETNKNLCPPSEKIPSAYRCVVTKYLSVVYRFSENEIELVTFIDNRMEHPY